MTHKPNPYNSLEPKGNFNTSQFLFMSCAFKFSRRREFFKGQEKYCVSCSTLHRTYLETTIRPGAKFHEARLCIEREIAHINLAVRLEYSRRVPVDNKTHKFELNNEHKFPPRKGCIRKGNVAIPFNDSVVVEARFCHCCHNIFAISTVRQSKKARGIFLV